ncbi:MAG: hypothetical protein AVDCRST_MAG19-1965 [uncultured Thermomicrobiales bacterium]|uniref:Uncharacterized protein n=1 Tax=uncultured Thermomicrobiales bacterium TaxID=1645740 RepID=A0A6J4UWQ9_9BACT|nr:MAG: hypothetical protein AVDCRST_MAG19-1965 [uncultured Thermomicrobiales bacterium]
MGGTGGSAITRPAPSRLLPDRRSRRPLLVALVDPAGVDDPRTPAVARHRRAGAAVDEGVRAAKPRRVIRGWRRAVSSR